MAGVTVVAYNGRYHDQVVQDETDALRNAGVQVVNELPICLVASVCARADIFGRDPKTGKLFIVEVKTGQNPKFTPNQLAVYPHLDEGGLVNSLDPRLSQFGLTPGAPLPSISGILYYMTGPGASPVVVPF